MNTNDIRQRSPNSNTKHSTLQTTWHIKHRTVHSKLHATDIHTGCMKHDNHHHHNSYQRPHTSTKKNEVRICSPYQDPHSRSRLPPPKFNRYGQTVKRRALHNVLGRCNNNNNYNQNNNNKRNNNNITLTLTSFCSRLKTHLFSKAYRRALVTA